MAKRLIIKLSGEAISNSDNCFDDALIEKICKEIKEVKKNNNQIILTIGGGNFWRGVSSNKTIDRCKSDQIGMLGTIMNGIYLSEKFKEINLKSIVMTPFNVGNFTIPFSKDLAIDYLLNDFIVINSGGIGHPYFSTDTVTALRAAELEADCVLYAKNIDGIYNKDPKKFKDAKKYKYISYDKIILDNLNAIDIEAINISKINNMDSYIFSLNKEGSIINACNLEESNLGTKITVNIEEQYYD